MDGFEWNKVISAVLVALLIGMVATKVSDIFVTPHMLEKAAFSIEGVADNASNIDAADAAPEELPPIEPLLAKASVQEGQKIAKKCLQCHTFEKGGKDMIGPNLFGIVGAKVAHRPGFPYSKDMQSHGGKWDAESINKFIHNPRQVIKGTKMSFAGLKKPQERADVIAYLKTLS